MPGSIHILSEALAQMIAAGEVIERPASVVKELMENAIDAQSSEITVELKAGGLQLIRVADNGSGMDREDAPLALQRHATSKIRKVEDLYAIETLGFRGEALPSIASVSHLVINTRPPHALNGTRLVCMGGVLQTVTDTGCPVGTEIEVRNLFYNLPARRKFLRSTSQELRHTLNLFMRLSLSHPAVAFRLIHEGRTLQEHLRADTLQGRAEAVLGREIYRQLMPFTYEEEDLALSGLAGLPTLSRGNGDGIYLYLNRRFVKDRAMFRAVLDAYRQVIPQGRFPVVILFITLPPSAVDVNVHPTKTEVKFKDPDRLFSAVVAAIRCLHAAPVSRGPCLQESPNRPIPAPVPSLLSFPEKKTVYPLGEPEPPGAPFRVSDQVDPEGPKEAGRPFRILGQVQKTYILYEDAEGLVLLDQHAAHERILFEKLKTACQARSLPVVRFLTPVLMDCSFEESLHLNAHLQDLHTMGFEIDSAGERTFAIRSIPALIDRQDPREVIREILETWALDRLDGKSGETITPVLITLSCHGAVRANFEMREEEMAALLSDLESYPPAATCPHGRPIFLRLPYRELARQFKRKAP